MDSPTRTTNLHLPPQDVWLPGFNPELDKLETPVDHRGLVDMERLVQIVASMVEPEYIWPLPRLDNHHIYWFRDWYPQVQEPGRPNPHTFRELPIHKARLPRVFHNWIHHITLPPPIPSEEVMHYQILAFDRARSLFYAARRAIRHERAFTTWITDRHDLPDTEDRFMSVWIPRAKGLIDRLESAIAAAEDVPEEFKLTAITSTSAAAIAQSLGRLSTRQHVPAAHWIPTPRTPNLTTALRKRAATGTTNASLAA